MVEVAATSHCCEHDQRKADLQRVFESFHFGRRRVRRQSLLRDCIEDLPEARRERLSIIPFLEKRPLGAGTKTPIWLFCRIVASQWQKVGGAKSHGDPWRNPRVLRL